MIPRRPQVGKRPETQKVQPPTAPGVETPVLDLEFHFVGPEVASFTLYPEDTITNLPDTMKLNINGTEVIINRANVAWVAARKSVRVVPVRAYVPQAKRDQTPRAGDPTQQLPDISSPIEFGPQPQEPELDS